MQPDPRLDGMERRYWQPTGEKVMRGKERKTRPSVSRVESLRNLGHGQGLGAGITDAQTLPVAEIAKAFYARHTWASLSFLPAHNLLASWLPVAAFHSIKSWVWLHQPLRLPDLANLLFASQRFCIECALGITAAPVVIAGGIKTLARKQAGKIAFCLYLIPA